MTRRPTLSNLPTVELISGPRALRVMQSRLQKNLTFAVCTRDRPEELARMLRSVLEQDLLPSELLVVDDGRLPEVPLRGELEARGVRVKYVRKSRPGLIGSRNISLDQASTELLMLVDDDLILQPGYIRALVGALQQHPDAVGVCGTFTGEGMVTAGRLGRLWYRLERFFLLNGKGHRVLVSGFNVADYSDFTETTAVSFLCGCATYRLPVLKGLRFDPQLEAWGPYALGEDLAFSWAAGRRGRLLAVPAARLANERSDKARTGHYELARIRLFNQHHIYRTCFRPEPARPLAFAWAALGKGVITFLQWLTHPDAGRRRAMQGTWSALAVLALAPIRGLPPPGRRDVDGHAPPS